MSWIAFGENIEIRFVGTTRRKTARVTSDRFDQCDSYVVLASCGLGERRGGRNMIAVREGRKTQVS